MISRLKLHITVLFLLAALSGCSPDPALHHSAVNTLDFASTPDNVLCSIYGYGKNRAEDAEEELRHRNTFTDDEWSDIENSRIRPGMSLCAVYAAFTNISRDFFNKKDPHGDDIKEITYDCKDGRAPLCPFTRVSLKNDRVTGIKQLDSL